MCKTCLKLLSFVADCIVHLILLPIEIHLNIKCQLEAVCLKMFLEHVFFVTLSEISWHGVPQSQYTYGEGMIAIGFEVHLPLFVAGKMCGCKYWQDIWVQVLVGYVCVNVGEMCEFRCQWGVWVQVCLGCVSVNVGGMCGCGWWNVWVWMLVGYVGLGVFGMCGCGCWLYVCIQVLIGCVSVGGGGKGGLIFQGAHNTSQISLKLSKSIYTDANCMRIYLRVLITLFQHVQQNIEGLNPLGCQPPPSVPLVLFIGKLCKYN